MRSFVLTLSAAFALVATPVLAFTPEQEASLRQSCSGDYLRFCGNLDPNSPAVKECFRVHAKELSPACQGAIGAYVKETGGTRRR